MMTVRQFIHQSSAWNSITPTLERVVRWCNREAILSGAPIRSGSRVADPFTSSLISEAGFRIASLGAIRLPIQFPSLEHEIRRYVQELPNIEQESIRVLTISDWAEAFAIARSIRQFASSFQSVEFSPYVPGCGIVVHAEADILADGGLIEVKTVNRNFRSSDLRQLLAYAAMLYATGRPVNNLAVLNPRLGLTAALPVSQLARAAGAGTGVELMQDLIALMIGFQTSA